MEFSLGDLRLLYAEVYLNGRRREDAVCADPKGGWTDLIHRSYWGPTLKGGDLLRQRVFGHVRILLPETTPWTWRGGQERAQELFTEAERVELEFIRLGVGEPPPTDHRGLGCGSRYRHGNHVDECYLRGHHPGPHIGYCPPPNAAWWITR